MHRRLLRRASSVSVLSGLLSCLGLLSSCATLEPADQSLGAPTAPPVPIPPEQESARIKTGIKSSGPVAAELADVLKPAAEQAFRETFGVSSDAAKFSGEASCFLGGCLIDVSYSSSCFVSRAERAAVGVPTSGMFKWPGAIYKTPSVKGADGRLNVTWVFLVSATPKLPDDQGQQFKARQRARLDALVQKKPPVAPLVIVPDTCTDKPILRSPAGSTTAPANPNNPVAK